MSKKKGKSQSDNINWDEGLINEKLADDKWQPFIAFIIPSEASCDPVLSSITSAVEEGTRRRFCIINKDAMLASAKDEARLQAGASAGGGGGKKSKMGNKAPASAPKPLHPEVCEQVVSAMNSGGPVPQSLVARMLKYKILRRRTADLAAKEALLKEAEEALKAAKGGSGKNKASTGRGSKKGKETPSGKGGKGGDSSAGNEFPMPQKPQTTMKKRGEEDTDSKYIDDEPVDGPDAYLLLTGFDEAQVLQHMEGIGVMVNAVVKAKPSGINKKTSKDNNDSTELSEEEQALLIKRENDLEHYWYHVEQIVSTSQDGSAIRNMATIEYQCPPPLTTIDEDTNEDEKKEFNQSVFTSLAQLLYNLLISFNQYQNYLKYLDIKNISLGVSTMSPFPSAASKEELIKTPEAQPETPISKRLLPVDMRLYNKLMDDIPTSAISSKIILHCMVEQVTSTLSEPSETTSQVDVLRAQLNDSINDIIAGLPLPKHNSVHEIAGTKNTSTNSCINWNDDGKLMSINSHASSCIMEANKTAIEKSLQSDTISFPQLTAPLVTQYEKQLHALKYFCTNIPGLQVDSVLKGLLATLSLEHVSPPSASKIPSNGFMEGSDSLLFDYPLVLPLKIQESSETALVPVNRENEESILPQAASPAPLIDISAPLLSLSNYTILEPLSHEFIYQMVGRVHHSHPYMYLYHHKLTGSLILAMYSGYGSDECINEYTWNRHLHTQVGFNNYLKHIQKRVGEEVDRAVEVDNEQREEIEEKRKELLEAKKKEIEEKQAAAIAKQEADSKQSSAKGGKKSQTDSKKSSAGKKSALASGVQTPAVAEDLELISSLPQFTERTLYSGYDIGDTVLISMGEVSKVFTSDGVCIVKEKRQVVDGPITEKVKIVDKHVSLSAVFIQSTGPQPPPTLDEPSNETPDPNQSISPEPKETEIPNPIPQPPESILFSAVEGTLYNGVSLSVSHYGPLGDGSLPVQPKSAKILEKLEQNRPDSSKDSRPSSQQTSGKVSKRQQEEQQKLQEQQKALEEKLAKEKEDTISKLRKEREMICCQNKYQQLNVSTKHGLQITCSMNADSIEENETGAVMIEQQDMCGNCLPPQLSDEKSRIFLSDGNVLKYMKDKSIVVLCKDGNVLRSQLPGSPYEGLFAATSDDDNQQPIPTNSQTKVSFIDEKGFPFKEIPSPKDAIWQVTEQDGSRCILKYIEKPPKDTVQETTENEPVEDTQVKDGENTDNTTDDVIMEKTTVPIDPLPTYTATDPETKEVLITRQDKVMILKRPNGSMIAEHFDGTRITSHPSQDGSTSVIIEHPVFARVTYASRDHCTLDLPNDFHIQCKPLGEYDIREGDRNLLSISSKGSVTYKHANNSTCMYKLSHSNSPKHVLKAKDGMGRKYSVSLSNGISISGGQQMSNIPQYFLPQIFVLNRDGDGFQLCNKKDVEDFVASVDSCATTIITRDKLPQCPSIDTLTVISTDITWANEGTLPFIEGRNIVPKNLKCSDTCTVKGISGDPVKRKRFGVGVGKGLSIGSYVPPLPKKIFQEPSGLKYRQFIDFSDCGLRESLLDCLALYIQWREKTQDSEDSLLPDPHADKLQENEALKNSVMTFKSMTSMDDLLNLYKKTWEKENISRKPPIETNTKKPQKIAEVESISLQEETSQQTTSKDSESIPDMNELASKLPITQMKQKSSVSFHLPDHDGKVPPLNSTPVDEVTPDSSQSSPITNNTSLTLGLSELEISTDTESSPGTFRSTRGNLLNTSQSEEPTASPMPRPNNPTPSKAQSNATITSTPIQSNEEIFKQKVSSVNQNQSLESTDYRVKLPRAILGAKPGNTINEKFQAVEEPVRRKVYTSSTTQGATARGFEIFPESVNFGNLREGCTYAYTCTLKNIGIDTCQFKIKPPPPSTGIRVLYSPGIIAAGMSREVKVEIFALAVGASSSNEVGGVNYELEIISEANILYLPIKAYIFPSLLFKQCFSGGDSLIGAAHGTQLVTERPSSREDLNRPSKK